ncbi:MAG: non-ribosomal peptide synthetase, partial [Segetibacter sp.]
VTSLQTLIDHCLEQRELENVVFTPSDYGLGKHVSYEELDRFLEDDINGKTRKDLIESIYPLTGLQQGMLFHSLYIQGEGAYVEQFTCDLKNAKPDIIRETWAQIVNQHSITRTAFYYDAFNVPVQCVYKYVEVPIEVIDLRHLEEAEQEVAMEEYKGRESRKGFDFKAAPLMRLTLIQLGKDRYRMLWLYHHILLDGWSMPVLMEEFLTTYELLVSGKKVQAQEDDKYEDYIRFIERSDKEQEESYWRSYMRGLEESTLLPFIPTTAERTKGVGEYKSLFLQLDAAKTAKIQSFAQKSRLTVNTIMQGVWSYLLHSYTGSNDVVYGTIVSGRPDTLPDVERRVGMYINALPLHSRIEEQQKIADWLRSLQDQQAALRQYQHTALTEIQDWAGVQGDLFDTLFVFENYPVSKVLTAQKWSLGIENVKMNEQTNYPLTVIIGSAEQISIGFNYNSTILEEYYVREMRNHFEHVLMQMVENAESKLADIQLLSKKDEALFREFNKTEKNYPENKTIIDLFEEQVIKTPGRTAVVFEGQSLTYDQLNKRANQLAHLLRQKGVKEETLVPICMERRIEIVVGMLGTLKAGAAYVPIDPGYPDERISYMLGDTDARFLITTDEISGRRHLSKNVEFIELGTQLSDLNEQSAENLCLSIKPENLAYVIYTSGSTGTPKGVMIEHKGVVNLINWHNQEYKVIDTSRATAMAGVGFDAFGWEVWPYLSAGAALYIVDDNTRLSASGLTELFVANQITHSFVSTALVPAFIEEAGDKLKFLRYLLTGGDKLALIDTNNLRYSLVNNYGPTENSVVTTNYWLTEKETNIIPPIGKPIANTFVYIVNKHLHLTPVGVAGEICIWGA